MILPAPALLLVQDKTETKGKSYAQILAMGHKAWYAFSTGGPGGESTAGMSSAEGLYGDALAWRNDRLRNPRTQGVRKLLQTARNDAVEVGSAITGGGTMWNVTAAGLYADQEEAVYAMLKGTGKVPKRVVSDVDRAYGKLKVTFGKADMEPKDAKGGRASLGALRKDLDRLIAEAARWPRKGSDALLGFGVRVIEAAYGGE